MKLAYAFRNTDFYPYHGGGRALPPSDLLNAYLSHVRSLGFEGIELTIAIELHHHSITDNSWSILKLLKEVNRPNVGVNPDLKNMVWAYDSPEESCEDAIRALAPHAKYWHCMNISRIPLPGVENTVFIKNPLSEGELNFRFLIATMLEAGYTGYLAIEGVQSGDQLHIDGQSAAYARSLIDELHLLRK